QQLLAILYKKANRTEAENKKLAALIKAEKATERALNANAAITKMLNGAKEDERRARNHRLIQQGILFDLVGLDTRSRGEMLGALIAAVASAKANPEHWATWKAKGDALLAEKGNLTTSLD
ncbi:conjugal transfer protein TraD, partial [Xanthomonas campestris pv. campestris]